MMSIVRQRTPRISYLKERLANRERMIRDIRVRLIRLLLLYDDLANLLQ